MRLLSVFLMVVLPVGVANAQGEEDRDSDPMNTIRSGIAAAIASDSKVLVFNETGQRLQGRVIDTNEMSLVLAAPGGRAEVPLSSIVRIERPDGVGDGARAGLTLGVTLGLVNAALYRGPQKGTWITAGVFGNGLVFAGLGALIDLAFDHSKTLYERGDRATFGVRPTVAGGRAGVAFVAAW